ncbi:MAG: hypothetical protein AB1807_09435 [Pseudomonadota bacterium]
MLLATHRAVLMHVFFVVLFYPGSALAEVSDKAPTTDLFWAVGLVGALLCLAGGRIKPWLGVVLFAPAALWFISLFLEIHSSDVGPYLLSEQGSAYYWQAYAAFGAVVCGLAIGYVWHKRIVS